MVELVDLGPLRAEFPDGDTIIEIVRLFLDETSRRMRSLEESGRRRDAGATRSGAHNIKGAARSVGAIDLADRCATLEAISGRSTVDWDAAETVLAGILAHFAEVARELEGNLPSKSA